MSFVGTLNPDTDYASIQPYIDIIKKSTIKLQEKGCRIEVPVEQRWWEYGSALYLLKDIVSYAKVLNVGGGWDALTPVLASLDTTTVSEITECEPDNVCRQERERLRIVLNKDDQSFHILPNDLNNLPEEEYDAVYCISVLEHVVDERQAWCNLAKRVKKGGLLFITTDCMPRVGKGFVFDNLRYTNYTLDVLQSRVEMMSMFNLYPIGLPDYEYHGDQVYDYTFFRAGFIKKG